MKEREREKLRRIGSKGSRKRKRNRNGGHSDGKESHVSTYNIFEES